MCLEGSAGFKNSCSQVTQTPLGIKHTQHNNERLNVSLSLFGLWAYVPEKVTVTKILVRAVGPVHVGRGSLLFMSAMKFCLLLNFSLTGKPPHLFGLVFLSPQ